ncbi:non-specific lipid-transfer protein 1 [Phtheirospermum japonicum]|uniref:Non-specific lipid-transfer protein n=1 Tax=Phtheirospermum japonicum TaxID=374723 RepID=A0A830DEZ7_9LAMI|nr:non-specific lipid-transfer protein 1 [Phtheirospermum japonicum]
MKGAILAVIAILVICQLAFQPGVVAVTCGQVDAALMPCVGYLEGGAGPSPACCSGVKAVKGLAQTTADKRTCCGCVKAAAIRYTDSRTRRLRVCRPNVGFGWTLLSPVASIVTRSTNKTDDATRSTNKTDDMQHGE